MSMRTPGFAVGGYGRGVAPHITWANTSHRRSFGPARAHRRAATARGRPPAARVRCAANPFSDTGLPSFEIGEIDLTNHSDRERFAAAAASKPRATAENALFPPGGVIVPQVVALGEALFDVLQGPGVVVAARSDARVGDANSSTSGREGRYKSMGGAGDEHVVLAGGAPANLAAALASLGAMAAMVGPIGDDAAGRELAETLLVRGVNVEGLQSIQGAQTRRVTVHVDADGEREFVGFEGNNPDFADTQVVDLYRCPTSLFYGSEFIVCGTLGLAFPGSAENLDTFLEVAKTCELRTVVDVNWRPVFWDGQVSSLNEARRTILRFLRTRADLIKITVDEVEFLFGPDLASRALADPELVAEALGKNVRGVLVTAGRAGIAWAFSELGAEPVVGRLHAFTPPGGRVIDSTGAGDAFLAGFLAELLHRGGAKLLCNATTVASCVRFGAAVAAISLTGMGGIDPLPNRIQVEAFLAGRPTVINIQ